MKLLLIRHGQVPGNVEKRYIGSTDESLTEPGRAVILSKKETGIYPAPDVIFSSPMKRCLETAEILWPDRKPVVIDAWSEIDFGDFEYKNYKELSGDPRYQAWIDSGGTLPFPGGESMDTYRERVLAGFRQVCGILDAAGGAATSPAPPVDAAASVHLGTIRALLSALTDLVYFDINAGNGEGYLLTSGPEGEYTAAPFPGTGQ